MLHTFDCPHCSQAINLEESFTRQIEQQILQRFQHQQAEHTATLKQRQADVLRREIELEQAITTQKNQVEAQVRSQSVALRQQLLLQIRQEQSEQIANLQQELADKSAKVKTLSQREGDLLRQQRALEEQRASVDALVEKRIRTELKQLEALALQKARDESQFSLDQQQGLIDALRDQLAAMKRKIEQGSQQAQGEVMEVALEQLLTDSFLTDTVQEVGKGQNGADLIHDVRNDFGRVCGRVVYESKRTKHFSLGWIDKLKADAQLHKGDIAVLVTECMPKDLPHFGLYNGVYVCSYQEVRALAGILREGIIRVGEVQAAGENKEGKMQTLYDYLTGNEFRQCMESLLRSFLALKANLDREKRAMKKLWAEREKQIESVMDNTTCLIGHVKGIAGGAVADLPELELLAAEETLLLT